MIRRLLLPPAALVLALAAAAPLHAQTDVRINVSGGGRRVPVQIEAFTPAGDPNAAPMAAQGQEVLGDDLENSSVFLVTRSWRGQQPFDVQAIVGARWTVRGDDLVLDGQVSDFPARRPILSRQYRGRLADWRALVHAFADDIVLQFTGEPGIARTRIAFVVQQGRNKELWVMDYDGANARALTSDRSIALSPAWSPEGSLLLFSSYRGGGSPHIYVIPASGGRPYLISGRPGNITSPAYSPDGREIACTLSLDGNPEIYRLDARGGDPRRLTSSRAIDTSPSWSPTGREIAFTSDRGGTPQVYVMDRDGSNVHRLTYEVNYTDSPAWSPKGDQIAFVSRSGAGFDVYVCRADGSGARLVASGGSNENPHWSPDGRHLVFASNRDGGFALYVSDLDNRPPRKLDTGGRRASNPAWSPRLGSSDAAHNPAPTRTTGGKP